MRDTHVAVGGVIGSVVELGAAACEARLMKLR